MSSIPVVTAAGQGALAGTPGAVPYIDATGVRLASDAAALSYDATNTELDIAGPGTNNATVYATASGSNGVAVWGDAPASGGVGVEGRADNTNGIGVFGKAWTGSGVEGSATSGIGVRADVSAVAGTGVQIEGPASMTGPLIRALVNNVEKFAVGPSGRPRFVSSPPSSAADTGTAGEIAWDSTHFYVCVATDTWVRVTLATWP